MLKWLALFIAVGIVAFAIYLYSYLGVSEPVEITKGEAGPFVMLYQEHRGPYHLIGEKIAAVEKWALAQNLGCSRTFGEYLDDPESSDEDRLRSQGGCLLPTPPQVPLPEGFKVKEIPLKNYVIARYKGSPAISPFTVYPKVKTYVYDNRIKIAAGAIEIYEIHGARVTTQYLFEIP